MIIILKNNRKAKDASKYSNGHTEKEKSRKGNYKEVLRHSVDERINDKNTSRLT